MRFEREPVALAALERLLSERYPTLHVILEEGKIIVTGSYALVYESREIDRYSLCIGLPEDYPTRCRPSGKQQTAYRALWTVTSFPRLAPYALVYRRRSGLQWAETSPSSGCWTSRSVTIS